MTVVGAVTLLLVKLETGMRRIIFKLTRRLRPQHCQLIRLPLGTPKDRSLFSVLDDIWKEREWAPWMELMNMV